MLGCAPLPPRRTNMEHLSQNGTTVASLLQRAYLQMASADIDGLMELYEEDAIIQSARESPVSGAPAIRRFWSTVFERQRVRLVPRVDEEVTLGDVVVARGSASGKFVPHGAGTAVEVDVWFLQVYRRGPDGKLRFWRGANGPRAKDGG